MLTSKNTVFLNATLVLLSMTFFWKQAGDLLMAIKANNGSTTATIGFEQQIWRAADILRGNINNIAVYGQDSNPTTWKMAQMNLAIHGIEEQKDDGEPFDEKMARLTSELSVMFKRSHELEDEIRKRLGAIGFEI